MALLEPAVAGGMPISLHDGIDRIAALKPTRVHEVYVGGEVSPMPARGRRTAAARNVVVEINPVLDERDIGGEVRVTPVLARG